MRQARKSAVLYGEFGCGNYGNEASLDSVLAWLRTTPEIAIRSITREPMTVMQEHGVPSVSMYSDRTRLDWLPTKVRKAFFKIFDVVRMVTLLSRSDTVIVPGTGVFEQQLSGPPWGLPLSMYALALASRIRGAQLALVGVGASYDSRPTVRWLTRRILECANFVSVRDEHSKGSLAGVGVNSSEVGVYPDVVFTLSPPGGTRGHEAERSSGKFVVGLGVIAFHDPDSKEGGRRMANRYELEITQLCRWLIEQGHHVRLLIGDAGDTPVADRVSASAARPGTGAPTSGTVEFVQYRNFRELIRSVETTDLVIGSRYHNLVFALLTGTPAISIGYADKCAHLLSSAGLADFALRIETADKQEMVDTFERLVTDLGTATRAARKYQVRAFSDSLRHRDFFLKECFDLSPADITMSSR